MELASSSLHGPLASIAPDADVFKRCSCLRNNRAFSVPPQLYPRTRHQSEQTPWLRFSTTLTVGTQQFRRFRSSFPSQSRSFSAPWQAFARAARRDAREAGLFVSSGSGQACREAAVWALPPSLRIPLIARRLHCNRFIPALPIRLSISRRPILCFLPPMDKRVRLYSCYMGGSLPAEPPKLQRSSVGNRPTGTLLAAKTPSMLAIKFSDCTFPI